MTKTSWRALEILALFLAFTFFAYLGPWWLLVVPAAAAGAWAASRRRSALGIALLAALSWVLPAFVHDAGSGWRISARVAAVMSLPTRLLLYVAMALLVALLAWLAAVCGTGLREAALTRSASKRAG